MIWRYDGTFPENESRNQLGLNDVYATLCELAGVSIPYASALDSVSFASYIASTKETRGLRQYLETWAYGNQGIAFQQAVRYNDLKLVVHRTDTNGIELFNLTSDISEMTDLSQSASYAGTMKIIYEKLLAVSPCPDDVLGTFSLSKSSEIVDCSWFMTEKNIRCSEHIEGGQFCNPDHDVEMICL
jgi:hypothetical protein